MMLSVAALTSAAEAAERRTPLVNAIARAQGAIVNIRTMRSIPARFDEQDSGGRVRGLGTGVIIDPRGYVVTNYHVVAKVDDIQVMTSQNKEFSARVLNFDEKADIAVLKIEGSREFKYLPLWGAGKPILGEQVIAIGNPYGLENTVTTGIVSAINRELKLPNNEVFRDLIQTDASINPGNSGGPLLNIDGNLLGINVAIRSNAQGIGFAIPTDRVREIVNRVMGAPGEVFVRQGLILQQGGLNDDTQDNEPNPILQVSRVEPGSPAFDMGFRSGDKIVSVAGQNVHCDFDINRVLWDRKSGDSLVFQVLRGEKDVRTIKLVLEGSDSDLVWQHVGLRVTKVDAQRVRPVYAALNGGLYITQVAPKSPADTAGLRTGDILIGLHEWETVELNNIRYVMQWKELMSHQPVKYHVIRDNTLLAGEITIPVLSTTR